MRKAFYIALLAVLSSIVLISCSNYKPDLSLVTEDYPPLTFMQDGVLTGYGVEVVEAIQAKLGTKFATELMSWDKAYEMALSEPNVVIYTLEKTRERENLFYFVGPLGVNTASFYIRKDSPLSIQTLEDARKLKSIATTSNWFTELYLRKNEFTNLISKEDPKDNIRMVISGEAEASVFTNLNYNLLAEEVGIEEGELIPVLALMTTEYYIGISKTTHHKVAERWQKTFDELVRDGTIETIKAKWLHDYK